MRPMVTILQKELRDALRDRRALATIFIAPALNILLIFVIVNLSVYLQQSAKRFVLPVQGIEYAQPIVDWLEEHDVEVAPAPEEAIEKVKAGKLDMVLIIPSDFAEKFDQFDTPALQLVYDKNRKDILGKATNIKIQVQQWAQQIGALRLIVRGVSPKVLSPVKVQDYDISSSQSGSSMVFGLVALILTITTFTTSTGIAIDMMAGERERFSLESLLLTPVTPIKILFGKWLTACIFTLLVVALVLFALGLLIPRLPFSQLGIRGDLAPSDVLQLFIVLMPLVTLSTILQLFISISSKTYKEAQSYIGLLMILPIFVGYFVVWSDVSHDWQYWVPLMSTQMLMEDVLDTQGMNAWHIAASTTATLVFAFFASWLTSRQLNREKIIYG
ncbi:ABC transporter permease [Aurantivibrio plasticivorans]